VEESISEQSRTTRIVLISETAIYRDGLRLLLDAQRSFHVVGTAAECAQAVRVARNSRVNIFLLDLPTPLLPKDDALETLARTYNSARIIVLVPALDKFEIIDALRRGVRGVLLKAGASDLLFRSIRAVAAGQYWVGRDTVADLVQSLSMLHLRATAPRDRKFGLTARELEIVAALVEDCVNKEIAKRFAISEKTVKHHLTNIFDKLGVSNRLELVIFALHHHLVTTGHVPSSGFERRPRSTRSARAS
jgi:two-component system nitrate/nitrite response regulator NarL